MTDKQITIEQCQTTQRGFMNTIEELENKIMSRLDEFSEVLIGNYEKPGLLTRFHMLQKDVDVLKNAAKKVDNRKLDMVNWVYKAVITLLISFVAYKIGLQG